MELKLIKMCKALCKKLSETSQFLLKKSLQFPNFKSSTQFSGKDSGTSESKLNRWVVDLDLIY